MSAHRAQATDLSRFASPTGPSAECEESGVDGASGEEPYSPVSVSEGFSASQSIKGTGRGSKGKQRVVARPVANACTLCRQAKVKCSGKHPTCQRCHERELECTYDVSEEGISKLRDLRQKLDAQAKELLSRNNMLKVLRESSDHVAAEVLARLRLGQTDEQIHYELGLMESATDGTTGHAEVAAMSAHQSGAHTEYAAQFSSLSGHYHHSITVALQQEDAGAAARLGVATDRADAPKLNLEAMMQVDGFGETQVGHPETLGPSNSYLDGHHAMPG